MMRAAGWSSWAAAARLCLVLALASASGAGPAAAQQASAPASPMTPQAAPVPGAADPVLEAQVMRIAAELRCLVCQNQTIADSNAGLAVDLRNQVREMLRGGATREQVTDYMTQRYGDFVLYRPPVKSSTALLWFGPAALLVLGVAVLVLVIRRRARLPADRFEPDPQDV